MIRPYASPHDEVLVAILNNQAALALARDQLWYRIPVNNAPRRWPPEWLAFYQTKTFEDEKFSIRYYGHIRDIQIVPRRELFPEEFENPKSDYLYYKLNLEEWQVLDHPIVSRRWRRLVFVTTTLHKFTRATEVNDLFDESPLEDEVWEELKRQHIYAERQWDVNIRNEWYMLDFAVFCRDRRLDIETDGDTWHSEKARVASDNVRDNSLNADRWHVLRFNTKQVRESMSEYVVPKITEAVMKYGGQESDGLISPKWRTSADGTVFQPSLLPSASGAPSDTTKDEDELT